MLENINIESILFLDIETAPLVYNYNEMGDEVKKLWDTKFRHSSETPENNYKKAGIFAEFAKVICISVGFMHDGKLRIKSYFGDHEKKLLIDFADLLNTHFSKTQHQLCAHNGKEFDFPFIARRMLVNGIKLPTLLNTPGKKPWEVNHIDTMELWKFGDYKSYTSLNLLAHIFGIPTPKDDIDGSDVARVYWEEKNMDRIATYCQKDVITVVQLYLKMRGENMLAPENIIYSN